MLKTALTVIAAGKVAYLPCVISAECEFFALIIYEETALHPDEGMRACVCRNKLSTKALICRNPDVDHAYRGYSL